MSTMIQIHNGVLFSTKLNVWHLKRTRRSPSIDSTEWNMAHNLVEKNMIIKKVSKTWNGYLYKGNSNNKIEIQLYYCDNHLSQIYISWNATWICYWGGRSDPMVVVYLFTSLVRILVCSPDQFLTQIIKEFQNSCSNFNLHIICGKCVGLDGGIESIVQSIQPWSFWPS